VRRFARRVLVVLLGTAVLYGAIFAWVWMVSRRDDRQAAEAIVVLGAAHYLGRPSPVLRARLDHAAALFQQGLAPLIVVTGGMAAGDRVSEATASQRYLVGLGVPGDAVVVRPVGRNTRESVASAAEWLEDRRLDQVILVSDPFHMARLQAEARGHGLTVQVSPTRSSPISTRPREVMGRIATEALKLPVVWVANLVGR
jgi:uncharacterized SAM-binding protein YcdF (DUF218 family)